MLTLAELYEKIADCGRGVLSPDDFEEWFCVASRGVISADKSAARDAAWKVEAAFSRYYFEDLSEEDLLAALLALVPAAQPAAMPVPAQGVASAPALSFRAALKGVVRALSPDAQDQFIVHPSAGQYQVLPDWNLGNRSVTSI